MTWDTTMTAILRSMVGDMTTPYTYSDSRLKTMLICSAYIINENIDFDYSYTVDPVLETLSPDPTSVTDTGFVNLTILYTVYVIFNSEYRTATSQAFNMKDGPSIIDGRVVAEQKGKLAKQALDNYNRAVLEYRAGNCHAGDAIIGPHRDSDPTIATYMFN